MITITAFMTSGGSPYSSYTPTISIWMVSDGTNIINAANMTNITSSLFKYDFASFLYGINYVYLITGDATVAANERYQWGSIMQDVPDRTIGVVVSDAGNSATQFKSDRTETVTDFWKDALCLLFINGSAVPEVKKVTGYSGSTKIMTFSSGYTGTPTNGDTYALINF
jgi:hypothetical protein